MNIEPYSKEWYHLRKTKIGASDASTILGLNSFEKPYDLMLQKLGDLPAKETTAKMQRGLDLEPVARELFCKMTGKTMVPKVVLTDEYPFMFASLDGIDPLGKEILEIKCPGTSVHKIAKKGKIPPYYYPQVQHQMVVTGLDMCYYFSFDGDKEGIIIEVVRDNEFIEMMIEKEKEFYKTMLSFVDENELNNYYTFECTI